jgi:hypothetical protein
VVQTTNISTARNRSLFSLESRLAFAPVTTYALLLAEPSVALWRRLGIFLLVVAVCFPIMALHRVTIATAAVVLGTSRSGARWRSVIHFIAVWAIGLEYVAVNVGGWFQITDAIVRLAG